jgi:hypothetical protein
MRGTLSHLTYANVVATLALLIAVGGGAAYAANTISSSDIINGEVRTPDIHTAAVTSTKVANESLTTNDIAGQGIARSTSRTRR